VPIKTIPYLSFLLLCSQHGVFAQSTTGAVDCDVSMLSIANYQLVSQQAANGGQTYMTYRATLIDSGMALGFVHATLSSLDPFNIRVAPGLDNLSFTTVPADSQTISSGTFTVVVNSAVAIDFTKFQWTFDTGPALPVAIAPNQTVPVGSLVTVDGGGSLNPSCGQPLTYAWRFTSRPPGSVTQLFYSTGQVATFIAGTVGTYTLQLTISNGVSITTLTVTITVVAPPMPITQ
jgi:hypothetical protein